MPLATTVHLCMYVNKTVCCYHPQTRYCLKEYIRELACKNKSVSGYNRPSGARAAHWKCNSIAQSEKVDRRHKESIVTQEWRLPTSQCQGSERASYLTTLLILNVRVRSRSEVRTSANLVEGIAVKWTTFGELTVLLEFKGPTVVVWYSFCERWIEDGGSRGLHLLLATFSLFPTPTPDVMMMTSYYVIYTIIIFPHWIPGILL